MPQKKKAPDGVSGATKGSSAMKFTRRLGGSIDIHVSDYDPAYTAELVRAIVLIASAKVGIDVAHWNHAPRGHPRPPA